jgi:hypothetical protein
MVKNVFLTAAATLILAAATIPVGSTSAMACHGCFKAAKAHLSTMKDRKAFRKECRAHHKAAKKAA